MIRSRAPLLLDSPGSAVDLWNFAPGDTTTEKIIDLIDRAVKDASHCKCDLISDMLELTVSYVGNSKKMRLFTQMLSVVDVSNHQVDLSRPRTGSLDWLINHQAYCEWRFLSPEAPNILYLHGPRGSRSAVIASHLITTLSDTISDSILISYSFNKREVQTQPIATFYVSIVRQLLLSQPSLFHRVSNISDWIESEGLLSYELLRSLTLCLLKGAFPTSIVCIIYGAQDCYTFLLDHIVNLLEEFRRLSTGLFKLVIFGEEPRSMAIQHATELCREIDLMAEGSRNASVAEHTRSSIDELVSDQPQWDVSREKILQKLDDPLAFVQTSLLVRLLETAAIPTTKSAILSCWVKIR